MHGFSRSRMPGRLSPASIADAFVADAKKALIALYGEIPRTNPDYSRVISAKEVQRLAALIDRTKVVIGGKSERACSRELRNQVNLTSPRPPTSRSPARDRVRGA